MKLARRQRRAAKLRKNDSKPLIGRVSVALANPDGPLLPVRRLWGDTLILRSGA